ncbi:MAG TPA: helix-turn-helix domain-containing protein, partial [Candidatus Hodarchaeales archaeon]|nr:helix-turn-helix domain-containing protein [Candidatus Hodarchaeales archaeon]
MPKLYVVKLNTDERNKLLDIVNKGSNRARVITRARILLWSDEGRLDEDIAASLQTTPARVGRIRKRYVLEGLEKAINDRP